MKESDARGKCRKCGCLFFPDATGYVWPHELCTWCMDDEDRKRRRN